MIFLVSYSYLSLDIIFFFNDTATTEIYTLSLHDALPILHLIHGGAAARVAFRTAAGADLVLDAGTRPAARRLGRIAAPRHQDRKSTRLNSSHSQISYAVFCLKKKKT